MLRLRSFLAPISAVALAVACSGCFLFSTSDSPPPIAQPMVTSGAADREWSVEVGLGEERFAPIAEGAHVSKVHGFQGGYHVPVAARLHGDDVDSDVDSRHPANVEVEVRVAGRLESRSVSMVAPLEPDGEKADFVDLRAFVGEDAHGEVTITIKVATASRARWTVASAAVVID
jgi:hypothetical protein